MPHARSSTRAPAGSRSARTAVARHADVHAERQEPVEEVVARRDAIEHLLDHARLLVAGARQRRMSISRLTVPRGVVRRRDARRPRARVLADRLRGAPARPRAARGGSGARPASVTGGQQRAERVDESLGLLVVGQSRRREAAGARARRTSRPPVRAISRVASWCSRASASRSVSGKPVSSERRPAATTVDVAGRVALLAVVHRAARASPSRATASSSACGTAAALARARRA